MWRIHFTTQDLAQLTIAASPDLAIEVEMSLSVLRRADGEPAFESWRQDVFTRLSVKDLLPILSSSTTRPAFFGTVTDSGDNQRSYDSDPLSDPEGFAVRYHEAAIAPYWHALATQICADIRHRRKILSGAGVDRLLKTLHPSARWVPPVLHISADRNRDLYLDGHGIELQAGAFCSTVHTVVRSPKPVLVYPIHHTPDSAAPILELSGSSAALNALIGPTRAAALRACAGSCSTTQLSRLCGISPAAASYQTKILREAGLITTVRSGSSVMHEITLLGISLLSYTPSLSVGEVPDHLKALRSQVPST